MPMYEPWTEDEEAELSQQLKFGMSVKQIAALHNRSYGAIQSRIKRMELEAVKSRLTSSGFAKPLTRSGTIWTDFEASAFEQAMWFWKQRFTTWVEMSEAFQRTQTALLLRARVRGHLTEAEYEAELSAYETRLHPPKALHR